MVDLPIPGNDDSIRSIELILQTIAEAVLEGKAALPPDQQAQPRPRPPLSPTPPPPLNPKPSPVVTE
jgi:small subunit ribosomal protein S2